MAGFCLHDRRLLVFCADDGCSGQSTVRFLATEQEAYSVVGNFFFGASRGDVTTVRI